MPTEEKPGENALGFNGRDLNVQTYRTTIVGSQMVHNVLPQVIVDLFNNLKGHIEKTLSNIM
jgi:hypothetical protein